ncbi:MAG: histidine kinase [Raineya sp.]|jgi:sensor histidine kinase YesM|nr:histidine kinase [Raineya sp.]
MLFSHKYRYIFILLLGLYSYFNTTLTEVFQYYPIDAPSIYIIPVFLLITAIIWEGNRVLQHLLPQKVIISGKKVHFLIIQFLASLPVALLAGFLPTYLIGTHGLDYEWSKILLPLKLSIIFSFRVSLFLHCLNVISYYISQYQQKLLEAEELKRTSVQAQLQSLRSQVNPHFLFNNLNVLSSLILKDAHTANEFVEQFSKVYRYVLKSHEKELTPLNEELDFIQSYLYLLQKRFADNLIVDIKIEPKYLEYSIVPVALQMLLENAIKHNIVSQKKPLKILIYTSSDAHIIVSNSLQRKTLLENDSTLVGLKNIAKHYQLLSHKNIEVIEDEAFFKVKLPLIDVQL